MKVTLHFFAVTAMLFFLPGCGQPGNDIEMQGRYNEDTYAMCREMMRDPAMMREKMDNMMREYEKDFAMCSMMSEKMMDSPHMRDMMKKGWMMKTKLSVIQCKIDKNSI